MTYGVDYTSPLPVAALKAKGVKFVVRYLAPLNAAGAPSWKEVRATEVAELHAAGIATVYVWEAGGAAAAHGYAQGRADATAALARLSNLGIPLGKTRPIYFAVDYDAPAGVSSAYINGARSVLGFTRTGVYGGLKQVRECLDARSCAWAWQTLAWSRVNGSTKWDSRAHIRQTGSSLVGRTVVDDDTATVVDFGQTPAPVVAVKPTPVPPAAVEAAAKYPGKAIGWGSVGAPVRTLQRSFGIPVTGVYNSALSAAVNAYQKGHPKAKLADRVGPGGVGRFLYAGIIRQYPKG